MFRNNFRTTLFWNVFIYNFNDIVFFNSIKVCTSFCMT